MLLSIAPVALDSLFTGRPSLCVRIRHYNGLSAEYWTRNRQGAGSTLTWFTANNLEQVANLGCAQAKSASYLSEIGNE